VSRSTQVPWQSVSPGWQDRLQVAAPSQTKPGPHASSQSPQCSLLVFTSTQMPSQSVSPGWQDRRHLLAPSQRKPESHAVSQSPQCSRSVSRSTQVPWQSVSPGWQDRPQEPAPSQRKPGPHALSQSPQCSRLVSRSTQVPMQVAGVVPTLQLHVPLMHALPVPVVLLQSIQLEPQAWVLVCVLTQMPSQTARPDRHDKVQGPEPSQVTHTLSVQAVDGQISSCVNLSFEYLQPLTPVHIASNTAKRSVDVDTSYQKSEPLASIDPPFGRASHTHCHVATRSGNSRLMGDIDFC
jgi:hypothetical protein